MRRRFQATLQAALECWGLPLKAGQVRRLGDHYEAMVAANQRFNLTRITEPEGAAVKHYADSLAPVAWARERGVEVTTVLDIGTGAGFPAVPLAVARPDWSITAIDATRKKIDFLESICSEMSFGNLRCVHAHSQHWKGGQRFSLVVFRALTAVPRAIESAAAYVQPGGHVAAFTTPSTRASSREETARVAAARG
ncbi:MAG: 16S rRNA (guanine(527)-N(7))-methyltransferase RsmG, partial [Phycisphaerae bacterium]